MINQYLYPINLISILHVYKELSKGRSILRLIHNFFLKNIIINRKTLDIGSKGYYSAYEFMKKDNDCNIVFLDNYSSDSKINLIKMNLEEKLSIDNNIYDTVILFNVIEHIENYKQLVAETNRILKTYGSNSLLKKVFKLKKFTDINNGLNKTILFFKKYNY